MIKKRAKSSLSISTAYSVLQSNTTHKAFYLSNKLTAWPLAPAKSKHKHSLGEGNLRGERRGTVHQATAWMDHIDLKEDPVQDAGEIDDHVSMRWRQ